jgi:hypothetical protein
VKLINKRKYVVGIMWKKLVKDFLPTGVIKKMALEE